MNPNTEMIAWMMSCNINVCSYSFIVADDNVPRLTQSSLKGRGKAFNHSFTNQTTQRMIEKYNAKRAQRLIDAKKPYSGYMWDPNFEEFNWPLGLKIV